MTHQHKGKKIFIFISLFLIFGSINNIHLNNFKLDNLKKINLIGLKNLENKKLLNDIEKLNLENIFFLNGNEIKKLIESNTLIENYEVFKQYPSTLNIQIERTKFLAKINQNGKLLIVGSNGKLSKTYFSDDDLPYIFGRPNVEEFLQFKKIIDESKISYDDIESIYFFRSKRWDLKLKNNILVKLSKDHTLVSLNNAFEILNNKSFNNIEIIDVRIENQIIING